jgi:hypothetical protein
MDELFGSTSLSPTQAQSWLGINGGQFDGGDFGSFSMPGNNDFMPPAGLKLGANLGTLNAFGSLAQTGFGIFAGLKQLGLAKRAQKIGLAFANRNLENQSKAYNTAMADRVANRQQVYAGTSNAMTPDQAAAYLRQNSFNTAPIRR